MPDRYVVELHSGGDRHKTWRVVRKYDGCIICVCVYLRGARRVAKELNTLTSGRMGWSEECDMFVNGKEVK